MFLFSRSAYVSSREKKEVDIGGEILETEIERQDVGMYSRMTGKTKVIMAVFGSILWTPGLRAEGFDIFRYKFCTQYFEEFYKYIAGLNFERIADHWRKSSSSSSDFLQKDEKVEGKIEKVITGKGKNAQNMRTYLKFLTSPKFSEIFFSPMKYWFPRKQKNGRPWGELYFHIERKKLKEGRLAFEVFGKYTLCLVRYEELVTGLFFEMIYCFEADGTLAGWWPTRLMAEWMVRTKECICFPDERDRVDVCQQISNLNYFGCTLGVEDFE